MPGLEPALRDLGNRGDIIKTMHRAMAGTGREPDVAGFALHGDDPHDPVLGRLVARGLDDELKGSAYAIVKGLMAGRTIFSSLTSNSRVTLRRERSSSRAHEDAQGRKRLSLAAASRTAQTTA